MMWKSNHVEVLPFLARVHACFSMMGKKKQNKTEKRGNELVNRKRKQ
jgi:hypothetical protein